MHSTGVIYLRPVLWTNYFQESSRVAGPMSDSMSTRGIPIGVHSLFRAKGVLVICFVVMECLPLIALINW